MCIALDTLLLQHLMTQSLEKSSGSCVAGFVETSPGKGTLDIYFPSDFAPDVQSIENVSIEVAEEVSIQIGAC